MSDQQFNLGDEVIVVSADDADREYGVRGGERGTVVADLTNDPLGLFVHVELDKRPFPEPFFPDQLRLA